MKTLTTLILLFVGFAANAQRSSYRQDINDDGKKLVIRIDQVKNGKEFHYSNTFDVKGMSDEEKSALVQRVLDSVRLDEAGKNAPKAPSAWGEVDVNQSVWVESVEPKVEVASVLKAAPFTKTIEEDTVMKRIKVSYLYTRNGEEHSYERTINKQGRTKEEIQKLIEETEESIGFSTNNS